MGATESIPKANTAEDSNSDNTTQTKNLKNGIYIYFKMYFVLENIYFRFSFFAKLLNYILKAE